MTDCAICALLSCCTTRVGTVLHNSTRFKDKGGQANQDIFLFQNLFRHWPMTGRKGFYVEAGANDPLYLSTSLFFDKCLGWDGLCVEPNEKFHKVRLSAIAKIDGPG